MSELEALEKFAYLEYNCETYNSPKKELFIIQQTLLKSQKQEKALKIIFEKIVNIFWLKECKSLEEYNYNTVDYMKLTQEEFDTLKRCVNK